MGRPVPDGHVHREHPRVVPAGITGFITAHTSVPSVVRLGVGTGFIGAFTTFSTLAYESLRLACEGAPSYAAANLLGSVVAGIAAAASGLALGAAF